MVECITGISFVVIWMFLPVSFIGQGVRLFPVTEYLIRFVYLGIVSCMIVIFFSDAKYHIIADQIQVALLCLSLFLVPLYGFAPQVFFMRVVAAFAIMAPILFLYYITHGGGMGFGDVKLAFIIGFMFGIKAGLLVLYIAFILGAAVGLIFMLAGKRGLKSKIAFGPFLIIGMIVLMFWSQQLYAWIQRFYGV